MVGNGDALLLGQDLGLFLNSAYHALNGRLKLHERHELLVVSRRDQRRLGGKKKRTPSGKNIPKSQRFLVRVQCLIILESIFVVCLVVDASDIRARKP